MEPSQMAERILKLEKRLRWMNAALGILLLALAGFTTLAMKQHTPPEELRLRSLTIVDDHGVPRVRIGSNLPDAVINGRRVNRGGKIAGILLYDDTGQERSGYVTFSPSGNVALTLDTRKQQVALFAAGPDGGAVARLWSGEGTDWIEMRSDAGVSRLTIGRANEIVFQQPPLTEAEVRDFCTSLKKELREKNIKAPVEVILRACKQRMPDKACRACLGIQ